MSDDLNWSRLDRYFGGELSPDEAAAVARWIASDPARPAEVEVVRRIWAVTGEVRGRFDVRVAKAKMHAKMAEPMPVAAPVVRRRAGLALPIGGKRTWAIAAGLASILAGAGLWYLSILASSSGWSAAATRDYVTSRGQRRELRLPDGTAVILGPESRLTLASTYGAKTRDVRLEGHGYFDVVHDEHRPFAVDVHGAVIRDLGTRFDVRAYPPDSGVRVAVAAGRVALGAQVLSPGQVGERMADGRLTIRTGVDIDRYLAWTNGRLVFVDVPLSEALPELSRWYGLKFQLADSNLARLPLNGTLDARPTAETLDLLGVSLGVSIDWHGDTIILGRTSR